MVDFFRKQLSFKTEESAPHPPFTYLSSFALRCCILSIAVGMSFNLVAGEVPLDAKANSPSLTSSQGDPASNRSETRSLFEQVNQLGIWSAIAPPAGVASEIRSFNADKTLIGEDEHKHSAPLIIPGLIDRPNEIDDRNVGPIPTGSTDTVEGSASRAITTTIPVTPDTIDAPPKRVTNNAAIEKKSDTTKQESDSLVNVYESGPRLLTQSADTAIAATSETRNTSAGIWQLAAAQLVATFLGVLFAVGLFLFIRVASMKLFGSQLGVTFQFGTTSHPSAQTTPLGETVDVVSFGTQSSRVKNSKVQPDAPNGAGGHADVAEFPLRVVGRSDGEGDSAAEGDVTDQSEVAILKTVLDNNLDLLNELDKRNGSAA